MFFGALTGFAAFTLAASGVPTLLIQSIQTFSITIAAGATSGTATISSVDTTKAYLPYGGYETSNTAENASEILPRSELTNATTVTAYRNTSDAVFVTTVKGTVVEFVSGAVQSTARGTITVTGTSATATISSVTTGNSVTSFLGSTSDATDAVHTDTLVRADLTNATTVTATQAGPGNDTVTGYTVLEFVSGVLNSSTQTYSITIADTTSSGTATISAVTLAQTAMVHGGRSRTGVWLPATLGYAQITDTTTVTHTRTGTTNVTVLNGTVVEYKTASITGVDRGTNTIAALATTQDSTIGAVTAAQTYVSQHGDTTSPAHPVNPAADCAWSLLQSTTAVRSGRNLTDTTDAKITSWEAIEFAA